jgi:hypothetical protein
MDISEIVEEVQKSKFTTENIHIFGDSWKQRIRNGIRRNRLLVQDVYFHFL